LRPRGAIPETLDKLLDQLRRKGEAMSQERDSRPQGHGPVSQKLQTA
jgi:hypothetical protein